MLAVIEAQTSADFDPRATAEEFSQAAVCVPPANVCFGVGRSPSPHMPPWRPPHPLSRVAARRKPIRVGGGGAHRAPANPYIAVAAISRWPPPPSAVLVRPPARPLCSHAAVFLFVRQATGGYGGCGGHALRRAGLRGLRAKKGLLQRLPPFQQPLLHYVILTRRVNDLRPHVMRRRLIGRNGRRH